MLKRWKVGILIFDEVEVLDFAGPFEVFSRARTIAGPESRRSEDAAPFEVLTVAENGEPITATGGLVVTPHAAFAESLSLDLLLIPGGFGTRPLLENETTLDWIRRQAETVELMTSVCTGSLLLARAGLLRGRRATTHWAALDLLAAEPGVEVVGDVRFVDDGVITSGGVAAGIDMAFYVVEKLCGGDVARETARYIDFPYRSTTAT